MPKNEQVSNRAIKIIAIKAQNFCEKQFDAQKLFVCFVWLYVVCSIFQVKFVLKMAVIVCLPKNIGCSSKLAEGNCL